MYLNRNMLWAVLALLVALALYFYPSGCTMVSPFWKGNTWSCDVTWLDGTETRWVTNTTNAEWKHAQNAQDKANAMGQAIQAQKDAKKK